jgi:hypothetical protein
MLQEIIGVLNKILERISPTSTLYRYTWTNTGVNVGVAPDINYALDVSGCEVIAVQSDSLAEGNTSTNFDINIHGSVDGIIFDTVPFTYHNVGNDERKTMLVDVSKLQAIKLTGDNNAADTTGYIIALIRK